MKRSAEGTILWLIANGQLLNAYFNARADGSNQSVPDPSAPNPNEANASDGRTE